MRDKRIMGKSTGHLAECTKRDFSRASEAGKTSGVFKILKSFLHHNRVGDILVLTGKITPAQLGQVLREERSSRTCKNELGQALIDRGMITAKELRLALFKQKFIRTAIATCAVFYFFVAAAQLKQPKLQVLKTYQGKSVSLKPRQSLKLKAVSVAIQHFSAMVRSVQQNLRPSLNGAICSSVLKMFWQMVLVIMKLVNCKMICAV